MKNIVCERLEESILVKKNILQNQKLILSIEQLANIMVDCIKGEGKVILCGNGGSASDALHFAGEIVGRFQRERKPWPAIVLNADVAAMTAIANDYGYSEIFSRQTEAYARQGDLFIGISTSGNSENVCRAIETAKKKGLITAALLGSDGGKIGKMVQYPLIIDCDIAARVQESHITIIHILCEMTENILSEALA